MFFCSNVKYLIVICIVISIIVYSVYAFFGLRSPKVAPRHTSSLHVSPTILTAPVCLLGWSESCDTCVLLPEYHNVSQNAANFRNCPGIYSDLVNITLVLSVFGISVKNNEDLLLVLLQDNISLAVILHN